MEGVQVTKPMLHTGLQVYQQVGYAQTYKQPIYAQPYTGKAVGISSGGGEIIIICVILCKSTYSFKYLNLFF